MKYLIDEKIRIKYNNNNYYLRIRSNNVDNDVVLFLHGGCGCPDRAQVMEYQSELTNDFTIVAWDQRGAGVAYNELEARTLDLTKDLYVEDAHNVLLYLKHRFNKEKIIVVGHSFGTVLGVWLAEKYPKDILAYIGVGQCVDYIENEKISYQWTLDEAIKTKDVKSINTLKKIGYPQNGRYINDHQKSLTKQRAILHKLGGATYSNRKPYIIELLHNVIPLMLKEYNVIELVKNLKGLSYCPKTSLGGTNPDFINTVKQLNVPVYLLNGHHDYNCSCELAEKWFNQLSAPKKKLIWFEKSAHSALWEEPKEWNKQFRLLFSNVEEGE